MPAKCGNGVRPKATSTCYSFTWVMLFGSLLQIRLHGFMLFESLSVDFVQRSPMFAHWEWKMQVTTPQSVHEQEAVGRDAAPTGGDSTIDDSASPTATPTDDTAVHTGDALDDLSPIEATTVPPKPSVGVRTLKERSKYHGEIKASGEPHGAGVLDSCFGSKYAGDFCDGKKYGYGVQVLINGSIYAGEFVDDQPSGYGVHTSPFAERYMGQWNQSARQGMGVCIESSAELVFGRFADNELDAEACVPWGSVQEHMQRALVAERRALRSHETARCHHLQAALEELSAVGTSELLVIV